MRNMPLIMTALAVASPASAQVVYQPMQNIPQQMGGSQVVVVGQQQIAPGQVIIAQPAQPTYIQAQPQSYQTTVPTMTTQNLVLPASTSVTVALADDLSSRDSKYGDRFDLTVSRDVMIGNYLIIPRGTPAHGQITYRTGKGAFGKSGKIEFDITDLNLNGQIVPLSGHFREAGEGNANAAVGVVLVAGVFGALVTGHSSVVKQGREYQVYTREPISMQISVPGTTNVMVTPQAPNSVVIMTPGSNGGYIRQ